MVEKGIKFGKLKAITELPKTLRDSPAWLCKCDCRSFIIISASMLEGNRRTHCGCDGGQPAMFRVQPNQRENMLVLISYTGRLDDSGEPIWLCKCDCGEMTEKPIKRVLYGLDKDCGCVFIKYIQAREKDLTDKKHNHLLVISKTGKKSETGENIWLCECDCGEFVELATGELNPERHSCGCYGKRLTSSEDIGMLHQGGTNMGVILSQKPARSASGVKGVCYRQKINKWRASMVFQGKTVLHKEFETFEEAVEARRKAEETYHQPAIEKFMEYHKSVASRQEGSKKPRRKRGDVSGVPGVTYNPTKNKWRARLIVKKKPVLDKLFDTLEEAVSARKTAEKLHASSHNDN